MKGPWSGVGIRIRGSGAGPGGRGAGTRASRGVGRGRGGGGGPRCAAGRRGLPLAGPRSGPAGAPHLPVAPLEDHSEGAVPYQVLARELELAHGLQAAAAGLHRAGGRLRRRRGPGAAGGGRAPSGRPGPPPAPQAARGGRSQPGPLMRIPPRLRLGLGFGVRLGLRRGNKRAAAAGPLSLRRRRRRSALREVEHGAGPGGAAALSGLRDWGRGGALWGRGLAGRPRSVDGGAGRDLAGAGLERARGGASTGLAPWGAAGGTWKGKGDRALRPSPAACCLHRHINSWTCHV